jgi:diguanylate cyclase (GGDEF)-like protein
MATGLFSILNCLKLAGSTAQRPEQRQVRLLAWILFFVLLFCALTLFIILIFNPEHDPSRNSYALVILGLMAFFAFAYGLNCAGYYSISAKLLVSCAALMPWVSLMIDPTILRGNFVPLIYGTFSVLLSSILLSTRSTIFLAVLQFIGVVLVFIFSPVTTSFNWFSFLAFIFLTSVFSILSNSIIQGNIKRIDDQSRQLALNEAYLRDLSIRDFLTNLFNRRYLEETLEREIQRAMRKQACVGVILLDLDQFKCINDTLGHAAGDVVLQEFSKYLYGQVRQSDVACRYGGDEFVLVLPDASRDITRERAEHLRNGARNIFVGKENQIPITLTISLGVAIFPHDGSTGDAIIRSADAALYQAKRQGSNRVIMASELLGSST